jgi:hypothetical protein
MNVTDRFAMDAESKRETARLKAVKRIAELEAALRPFAEAYYRKGQAAGKNPWMIHVPAERWRQHFARAAELVKEEQEAQHAQ